jgi:hypothetical protein
MTRDEKQQAWAAAVARRRAADIELACSILAISGRRPMTTAGLAQDMAFKLDYGELNPTEFTRRRKAIEDRLHRFARDGLVDHWVSWDNLGRRLWCLPGTVTKVSR